MNAPELLERARTANVTVEVEGNVLRLRAPGPPPPELLDELRANKRDVLAFLRAERQREAAVDDAWNRLSFAYGRYGSPNGWLTTRVRDAEAEVERWWIKAREDPACRGRFFEALDVWMGVALAFISTAGDRSGDAISESDAKKAVRK